MRAMSAAVTGTYSNSPAAIASRKAASMSGRSSTSQHTSTMTVVGSAAGLRPIPAGRRSGRDGCRSGRSPRRPDRCRAGGSRGALQAPADDLVMPLGEIAAAGFPDPGDRQVPPCGPVAFSLGGGGEFGVGGHEHAQPLPPAPPDPLPHALPTATTPAPPPPPPP